MNGFKEKLKILYMIKNYTNVYICKKKDIVYK